MGRADAEALVRAAHLGIAMQLTNIARDVGEDAGRDRVYLPGTWLAEAGGSAAELLAHGATPAIRCATRRVLERAESYYRSGIAGIALLPPSCRPGILSAALLYRAIGRRVAGRGGDGVTGRARIGVAGKVGLMAAALARSLVDPRLGSWCPRPDAEPLHAPLRRLGVRP